MNTKKEILQDDSTYSVVKKFSIRIITNGLKNILTRWKDSKFITDSTYRSLNTSDGLLPRVYGVPKVHKIGHY